MDDKERGMRMGQALAQSELVGSILFVAEAQKEESALDPVTMGEHADLFPVWDAHWTGKKGSIVRDGGKLYKAIHAIGKGQNSKPSTTPALWTRIGNPAEEWPEWIQPIGAHDAYDLGAKVNHGGKHWISNAKGNVWEPGVYGWVVAT